MCSSFIALTVMRNIVLPSAPTSSNPLSSTFWKLHHKKKKIQAKLFLPCAGNAWITVLSPAHFIFISLFGPKEPHKPSPYPVFFSILAFVTSSSSSSSSGYWGAEERSSARSSKPEHDLLLSTSRYKQLCLLKHPSKSLVSPLFAASWWISVF